MVYREILDNSLECSRFWQVSPLRLAIQSNIMKQALRFTSGTYHFMTMWELCDIIFVSFPLRGRKCIAPTEIQIEKLEKLKGGYDYQEVANNLEF